MGSEVIAPDAILTFGEFELDLRRQMLWRDGRPVALNAQPLKVLAFLALHADAVVTRESLQRHVWGSVLVEYDQGINACIRQIRAALNDDADEPRYIRTLRGTGYRFIATVRRTAPIAVPRADNQRARYGSLCLAAAAIVVIVSAAVWLVQRPSDPLTPAAQASLIESETLRQQGLLQLRRAIHGPSLDSARRLFNRATRMAYSSAPPVADWSIALAFAFAASPVDSVSKMAERMLGRALALDPQGAESALAAGFVGLFIRHRADSAVLHFRRAADADSARMFAWLGLGMAWREQGEWAHAIEALSRAARLDTSSEVAATEFGDALFHLRRFHDAHAVLSRVTVVPTSGALTLLRANVALVRGGTVAARRTLQSEAPRVEARDSLIRSDPTLARILGVSVEPRAVHAPLAALAADTLGPVASSRASVRRQIALAEGLLRTGRPAEAVDRLAWLLAVPSPVNLELVRLDPLWAEARRISRYSKLERLWSR